MVTFGTNAENPTRSEGKDLTASVDKIETLEENLSIALGEIESQKRKIRRQNTIVHLGFIIVCFTAIGVAIALIGLTVAFFTFINDSSDTPANRIHHIYEVRNIY